MREAPVIDPDGVGWEFDPVGLLPDPEPPEELQAGMRENAASAAAPWIACLRVRVDEGGVALDVFERWRDFMSAILPLSLGG